MIDSVSFFFHHKKRRCRVNGRSRLIYKNYLLDREDGIRQLLTWFLNLVMEEEALL